MCPSRGGGVKGSATSGNRPWRGIRKGPGHGDARRAARTGAHRPPGIADRPETGGVRGYLSQASTLARLASTHFFAAASGVILSTAMYLATVFWSSFVQWKFFTRS